MSAVQSSFFTGKRVRTSGERLRLIMQRDTGISDETESEMLQMLMDFCTVENCEIKGVLYKAPLLIAEKLHSKMGRLFYAHDIYARIIQLRAKFLRFRKFIDRSDVHLENSGRKIRCEPSDFNSTSTKETPEMAEFRVNGFPQYEPLRYIFINCHAALFDDEPVGHGGEHIKLRHSDDEGDEDSVEVVQIFTDSEHEDLSEGEVQSKRKYA